MKISALRNKPFILLVLKDGENEGSFSPEFMHKTKQLLSDMSLRIASDHFSIVYADQIKKACEVVLGIMNLGLLSLCDNDTDKATEIIKTEGIVFCFRAGWAKFAELKKIAPNKFKEINISTYALAANDSSDIRLIHERLVKEAYQSMKLLEVYNNISALYAANTVILETDEEVLKFELQKYLNSAVALLLIDSDKNVFSTSSYAKLLDVALATDKTKLLEKFEKSVSIFIAALPTATKRYLQDIELISFAEFRKILNSPNNIDVFLPEILELSVNITNELYDDFEGGYDFGIDDQDDIAYLNPNIE